MTPQELIAEIQKLSPPQQREVLEALKKAKATQESSSLSEDEVQQRLFEQGIIGNLPNPADYTDDDDNFEPIEVKGKLLSETIIEERR